MTPRTPSSMLSDALYLEELEQLAQASRPGWRRMAIVAVAVIALHGLVLFGIRIKGDDGPRAIADSIKVLLLHDTSDADLSNPEAAYLAQHGQKGSGTTPDVRHAQAPDAVPPADGDDPESTETRTATQGGADDDRIASRREGTDASTATRDSPHSPLVMHPEYTAPTLLDAGNRLALRGTPDRDLSASPDTRATDIASYLDLWRHRVERVGTAHYPLEILSRARLNGGPTVDVTVAANGHLLAATIARSSGRADVDRAALAIVQLAAPFEPFPPDLAAKHESLRLTYEWHFLEGRWQDPTVGLPNSSR